ncbi:MAG: flagellar M-ring protein FliF [Oscillospiraceae bacterium]|nr:flagellar M-ring protein FliF [Oscillospiraceae bacterium]
MSEQVQKVLRSFKQFWNAQDRKRKILYIVAVVSIIIIAIVATMLLNRKDYIILYQGLSPQEAGDIYNEIQSLGYEANVKSNGTIEVLSGTESAIAMELAMVNLPTKSDYNYFTENVNMFSTEKEKEFFKIITAEKKTQSAIESLSGVERAIVGLSVPEQKNVVVASNRQYPNISVTVHLARNTVLTNTQITGIHNLAKTSYPGLRDEDVYIIDGNSVPLIPGESDFDLYADLTRKLLFKNKLEEDAKNKISDILGPGFGDENVRIAVNYDLNFDRQVSESTDYGEGSVQHEHESDAWGGATVEGGIPGIEPNVEEYPTVDEAGDNAPWRETEVERTYLVDTFKNQIHKEGYSVDGLTIAVMLYAEYIPETTRQELVRAVATASGIQPFNEEGILIAEDLITVMTMPKFDDLLAEALVIRGLFGLTTTQLIAALAALGILLVFLVVFLTISSKSAKKRRAEFEQRLMATMSDIDRKALADGFMVDIDGELVDIPSLTDDGEETKEIVIRREIGEFARTSPDIVATLLKNWMRDS